MQDEWLPQVDEEGHVLGRIRRSHAHGDPRLIHPVVHCLVQPAPGQLVLQLRSASKDVDPGLWDTSVGGHVDYGESVEAALGRELNEELGLTPAQRPVFLSRWLMRTPRETELVHSYFLRCAQPLKPQPTEIERLEAWSFGRIEAALGTRTFTKSFEAEFRRFRSTGGSLPPGPPSRG